MRSDFLAFLGLTCVSWFGRPDLLGLVYFAWVDYFLFTTACQLSTRLERLGLGLVLFVFLLAAAAAFARSEFGEGRETSIRYSMLVVLINIGLLLCPLGYLKQVWRGAYQRSLQWLAISLCIVLLGQQIVIGRFAIREADQYKESWSRFLAGDWTPEMLHYVDYWDRDEARLFVPLVEYHTRNVGLGHRFAHRIQIR